MKAKKKIKLVTIKVTPDAVRNFNMAASLSGKTQYQVSEEGSQFICGKYMKKEVKK